MLMAVSFDIETPNVPFNNYVFSSTVIFRNDREDILAVKHFPFFITVSSLSKEMCNFNILHVLCAENMASKLDTCIQLSINRKVFRC